MCVLTPIKFSSKLCLSTCTNPTKQIYTKYVGNEVPIARQYINTLLNYEIYLQLIGTTNNTYIHIIVYINRNGDNQIKNKKLNKSTIKLIDLDIMSNPK